MNWWICELTGLVTELLPKPPANKDFAKIRAKFLLNKSTVNIVCINEHF